ncbi:50S ribosomal protein L16 [Paenibacillus sp. GCM10012307]|uniref:Large ribosomal subunit protein uL16 n=1 Tax=Paenibacillus roseus TaxID=2798579 RepID=A0A934MKD5_9BACL|nr:50S ribosomal protein L16 [Paenibacillus roseus]MBJ6360925.1 50S ribosomal protein L16 [Paenibacillus roseus]
MYIPKKLKYRKYHRGHLRGKALRGNKITFGMYGLQALEPSWITPKQIEAGRRACTRKIRRRGKVWIRTFADKPRTKHSSGTRMGSGKGSPKFYVDLIKPGRVLYELKGVTKKLAFDALTLTASKLPMKTKIIRRKKRLNL